MGTVPTAIVALVLTLVLVPPVLWVLRRQQILDLPNERSSHDQPTARGGGLAVVIGCSVALLLGTDIGGPARAGVLFVAVAMGVIGLVDDVRGLPPLTRLAAQILVAGASLPWLGAAFHGPVLFGGAAVVLWLVAYVNAFNFMDGINGLSVAQVVVAGVAWWAIGEQQHVGPLAAGGLVVAAGGVAFLPFNLGRAPALFLGDVGSYFLGGWLAAVAVLGLRSGLAPEAVLAPLAVYAADTATTFVWRLRRHQAWYQAHRDHAYQRLVQQGWAHTRTSALVAATMIACAALGTLSLTGSLLARAFGDVMIGGVVAAYLLSPTIVKRRSLG